MDKLNYIGKDGQGTFVFQELDKNGLIRGFNGYCLADLSNGEQGFDNVFWCHEVTIGKKTYKTGEKPCKIKKLPAKLDNVYECNVIHCSNCGQAHDSEEYSDKEWVITDCECFCKECVNAEDVLIPVNSPEDLFKAKDLIGIEVKGFKEVETLFCDSSGFGSESEPALTKRQAESKVLELLETESELFAGITGIGQFQVYVTLYKKSA